MLDCSSLWRFAAVRLSTTGNANCFFGVSLPSAYPQREMRTEKQSKPRQLGFFYTLQVRNMDIKFYYVNPDYIEHLKKAEIQARKFTCVPNVTYANRDKFFYGAVIKRKNGMCYYVPISSQAKNDANSIIIKTNDKINKTEPTQLFETIKNEKGEDVQEKVENVIDVAAGNYHTLILKKDGTVWTTK